MSCGGGPVEHSAPCNLGGCIPRLEVSTHDRLIGSVALPADERVSGRTNASFSSGTDFSRQRIKLVGKSQFAAALQHELTFADHVHEFDAG